MMNQMRENMPLIMWILVAAFLGTIIFSWGMGGFTSSSQLDGVIGKVGEKEILYEQYNRVVQDRIAQERQKDSTATIDDAKNRAIRKQDTDELVRTQLMAAYREKFGLVTSDEEVAWQVRNNPPQWLRTNPNFQTEGQFDKSKWDGFLKSNDPQAAQALVSIEADYRESIGNQKVIDRVIAPTFVSPTEVWDEYVATTRKFQAMAVSFPTKNFQVDSASITSSQIEEYYQKNKPDFQRKEKRKLQYVVIPVKMSNEDTLQILEVANEALSRAQAGEDFAALAKEYSEDVGSAALGGDLGYFTTGRMVKEFDSTAFNTDPGKVVGPISTRFGAHIIKVVDRQKHADADSVRASHILVKWKVGQDTEDRAAQKAKDISDAAKTDGFANAAARSSLEIKETDFFQDNPTGSIPGIGTLVPAVDWTFAAKEGQSSYVYRTKVRGEDAYVVLSLKEIQPAGVTPLAEVESQIRGTLIKKKQEESALEAAKKFRARVRTAEEFVSAAAHDSLKIDTTAEHLQRDFLRVFGSDEEIGRYMFTLSPGQVSEPLANARGGYIAVLLSKTGADSAGFVAKQKEIADRLRQTKQNGVWAEWLALAEKQVGVVDNRHLYFTDY